MAALVKLFNSATCTKVNEITLLVEGNGFPVRQIFNELYLVIFAVFFHERNRLFLRKSKAFDGKIALDDLLHFLFDGRQIFFVELHIAQIDVDKLQFPLKLRRWREGDWFVPYGMTGRKKISDFLTDRKVSGPERDRQFVLLSGEDIVWVVGRRIDDRYRLTNETETVLRITRETI